MDDIFDNPTMIPSGNIKLALYRAGPKPSETKKSPIVFMHGFPELARSFKHQMRALANAGYPVFAPDMRGYGRSDKPDGVHSYGMSKLVGDMEAVLDSQGINRAVFVGHDWGAFVLWAMPFYAPDRLLGCVALNYPLMPRLKINPMLAFRLLFHRRMYMLQFQKEGRAEPILERDIKRTLCFFMRKVGGSDTSTIDMSFRGKSLNILDQLQGPESDWIGEPLMDDVELDHYVEAFADGGFTKPIHYYRNMKANWKDMKRFLEKGQLPFVELPALIVTSEFDFATPPRFANGMHKRIGPLKRVDLKGCSHWVQMEKPDEVNEALLTWLGETFTE